MAEFRPSDNAAPPDASSEHHVVPPERASGVQIRVTRRLRPQTSSSGVGWPKQALRVSHHALRRWIPLIVLGVIVLLTYSAFAATVLPAWIVDLSAGPKVDDNTRLNAIVNTRDALLAVLAPIVVAIGAVAAFLNYRETAAQDRRTLELASRGQVTERFTTAVNQLGSMQLDIRLGGIYALEQIAKDSEQLHGPIMEILSAFLREHSGTSWKAQEKGEDTGKDALTAPRSDFQAVATVLSRRTQAFDPDGFRLNLSGITLNRIAFKGAQLDGVNFDNTELREASFVGAHLSWASFGAARLQKANFNDAELQEATFESAQLEDATFIGAQLVGAVFNGANLQRADFRAAVLQEASFKRAQLQTADFVGAVLHLARFSGAELTGVNFNGAQLQFADFSQAMLHQATFKGTDLNEAKFIETNGLTGSQLQEGRGWESASGRAPDSPTPQAQPKAPAAPE
jgi:uncharacterized protein YjbI with pentapeptide repeats